MTKQEIVTRNLCGKIFIAILALASISHGLYDWNRPRPVLKFDGGWTITGGGTLTAGITMSTVVIATDSVEIERLSPGGGTEEAVTYTYVSAPAYDSLYKKIFLDTAEVVEYNKTHKAKFR